MPEQLPRVVELVRVSTQGQADRDTPEIQRRALDRLRQSRPTGQIVARIEELGVSGAIPVAQRTGLRQLEQLSAKQAYDELRVYAVDRLTRAESLPERVVIWGLAQEAGAVIVDATGLVLDPKSDMGEMGFYMQSFAAAHERRRLRARTSAGRLRAAESGRPPCGPPPFARRYDRVSNSWVLVPDLVEVYRRIVKEALAGQGLQPIANGLNADGITTSRGGQWERTALLNLLRSESIVGRYRICGQVIQVPPIVDELTWARVKAAVDSRRSRTGPKPVIEALLRGLLYCSGCGLRAYVLGGGKFRITHGQYRSYACPPASRRRGGCTTDRFGIDIGTADNAVRDALLGALVDPKVLRAAVEAGRSRMKPVPTRTIAKAEADLTKLTKQEAQVLRLLGDGLLSEAVARDRLGQIRAATATAEQARRNLATSAEEAPAPTGGKEVERAAALLGKDLARASWSRVRQLLEILVPSRAPYGLRLYRDRIELMGRLPLAPATLVGNLETFAGKTPRFDFVPLRLSVPLRAVGR